MNSTPHAPGNRIRERLLAWCPAEARLTVEAGVVNVSLSWPRPPSGDLRGPLAEELLRALVKEAGRARVALRGADVVLRWRAPAPGVREIAIDLRVAAEADGAAITAMAQACVRTAATAAGLPADTRTALTCLHVGAHAGDLMPMVW